MQFQEGKPYFFIKNYLADILAYKFVADRTNSSPTMARCSAAKAAKNPETNFMAPGDPNPQVHYGPPDLSGSPGLSAATPPA